MATNNRRRGSAGEREAGHALQGRGWTETKRTLDQSREGGCDLMPLSPTKRRHAVEVKKRKRVALLYEALEQALDSAMCQGCGGSQTIGDEICPQCGGTGERRAIPVVMIRADHKPWLVVQTLEEWDRGR